MKTQTLSDRAMLVNLSVSFWTATKYDKKVTAKTNRDHGASSDAGRYNKRLLARDDLAEIAAISSKARALFYSRTVPWLYDGTGILSTLGYEPFCEEFRAIREQWETKVAEFVAEYPRYVESAKTSLNGMFNPADYPPAENIKNKFAMNVRFFPVPDADDFRAQVSDDQAKMIRVEIERSTREAIDTATRDVWQRVAETVGNMAEKLSKYNPKLSGDKRGTFRDSLISNVQEIADLLPSLNVTGDKRIDEIAERIKRQLCQEHPATLRERASVRKSVAASAAAIVADVSAFI